MKPTVLLVTTTHWFSTARLAVALADAGFVVEAVCAARHSLRRTSAVQRVHSYSGLSPLASVGSAIEAAQPALILPSDDLATRHLQDLHGRESAQGRKGSPLCQVIERSIGAGESFPFLSSRAAFMELAEAEGVRVPSTKSVFSVTDLQEWLARNNPPVVLKANGTSSGEGVGIATTLEEAEQTLRRLQAPPHPLVAAKRALIDQDLTLVRPTLFRSTSAVSAQTYVAGHESTSLVACWRGKVLAALHFEVIMKQHAAGPSSVLRLIEHPEMIAATEKMVRRLCLSGLHGFDFMLESATGNAYLIEINPRTTQVGHLTLGSGRDLPAALYASVTGEPLRLAPKLTENNTIALFPQEWTRNSTSPYLSSSHHDVPWGEPELVRDGIRKRGRLRAWYARQKWIQFVSKERMPRA